MLKRYVEKNNSLDNLVLVGMFVMFVYSIFLLTSAHLQGIELGLWIWERHQNLFSWYSRPLFVIPACYYAYRRKLHYTFGFILLMFASLFWFAAPEHVSIQVSSYLEWEKQLFFSGDSATPLIVLSITVVLFLIGLFYAFYKRSLLYGLLLINVGTILKIIVSITLGGESGTSAIVPSLSSILFIDLLALFLWRYKSCK